MSSVAVPTKMVPVPSVYGVEAFKEIKPEIVALHPVQHKNTEFTTAAQNRISFRVPAYSNALLDTARSFMYVKAAADGSTGGASLAAGTPLLSRMVVKTSAGLTLEDISDLDVLNTLLETLKPADHAENALYGNGVRDFSYDNAAARVGRLPQRNSAWAQGQYKEILFRFNFGVFSKTLTKFLPLFMADGGAGYSFDVDLYLSDRGLHNPATPGATLAIKEPVWYLHLVRMDEGLARRFNTMAVHGEEIRIPFVTWHTHRTSLQAPRMLAYIHENATNFKKIVTCIYKEGTRLIKETANGATKQYSGLLGGRASAKNKVSSYNYRIGVQHVYNEPVTESSSNVRTLEFVRSAFGIPDNQLMITQLPDNHTDTINTVPFEHGRWMSVASFDYSPSDASVIQGISSSNPVELALTVDDFEEGSTVLNYCELAYDLVFKGGAIHYEEQKPGSQSVY